MVIKKSLLFALILSSCSTIAFATPIELLNDNSFEISTSQGGQTSWGTSAYGSWAVGDLFSTVGSSNGITPLDGSRMLQFGEGGGGSNDLYQLVDVSAYASQIDNGLVSADLSVFLNTTNSATLGLRLIAWDFLATSFSGVQVLAGNTSSFTTDSNLSTWQQTSITNVVIPTNVRLLAIGLHDVNGDGIRAYADNASLSLNIQSVPEPSTAVLLSIGLLGVVVRRKKLNR